MKTYVISLDTPGGKTRRDKISKHLESLGISYTVQKGVDGRTLSKQERRQLATRACQRICTPSTIGCAASHALVWRRVASGTEPYAIVLEDDVEFVDNVKEHLRAILPRLPPHLDVLLLGCFLCRTGSKRGTVHPDEQDIFPIRRFAGTHAYLVTKRGAKTLLEYAFPVKFHLDATMTSLSVGGLLHLYGLRYDIARQGGGESTSINVGEQTPGFPHTFYELGKGVHDSKGQSLYFYSAMPMLRIGPYGHHAVITPLDMILVIVALAGLPLTYFVSLVGLDIVLSRRVSGVPKALVLYAFGRCINMAWRR